MSTKEKAPAIQWYPKDVLTSERVAMMTLAEEGAYRRALDFCWLKGSIPADPKALAALIGKGCSAKIAEKVVLMFIPSGEEGRLVHERHIREREKQSEYRQTQSENGKKGGRPRKQDDTGEKPKENPPLFQNKTEPEAEESSSSSSPSSFASSLQIIYLSQGATELFEVGLQRYAGMPSLLLKKEHRMWLDQKLYGTGVDVEAVSKRFDEKFKSDSFSTIQHFRNAVKTVIDDLKDGKNGNKQNYQRTDSGGSDAQSNYLDSGGRRNFR